MKLFVFVIPILFARLSLVASRVIEPILHQNMQKAVIDLVRVSCSTIIATGACLQRVEADSNFALDLDSDQFAKPTFNFPPSAFRYPASFQGIWYFDYKFIGSQFSPQFSLKQLSSDPNIAGFRKYSIAAFPDIGTSVKNVEAVYQKDTKSEFAFEDRSNNAVKSLISFASKSNVNVDKVDYDVASNPNRLSLSFTDQASSGKLEIFTNSRSGSISENNINTVEHFRQSTVRQRNGQRASQIIADYAICLNLIKRNDELYTGDCKILSYLQPQDSLFFERPNKPVAAFFYDVNMHRSPI